MSFGKQTFNQFLNLGKNLAQFTYNLKKLKMKEIQTAAQGVQVMISKDEFLKHSQVKLVLSRNKENNNPVKCVHSGEPTLGKLCRDYGNDFTEKYLCVWLIQIQELIGVKNKMNDFQIEMCAQMLLDEFKQINLADLQLVCKRAVSGVYGQFYESIQIPKVIEWFRLYFEERCEMSAMSNQQIKTSGKIESQASDTVKALMGLGVLNAEDFKKMEVKDEEEFRKFNVEYHREKIIKKSE